MCEKIGVFTRMIRWINNLLEEWYEFYHNEIDGKAIEIPFVVFCIIILVIMIFAVVGTFINYMVG